MWWLLLLGLPLLILAGIFMFRASPRRLHIIRALSISVVFATVAGVATDLTAVAWHTTRLEKFRDSPDFHHFVIQGIGEALSPACLGFTLLSLAWLFVAIGMRRVRELDE